MITYHRSRLRTASMLVALLGTIGSVAALVISIKFLVDRSWFLKSRYAMTGVHDANIQNYIKTIEKLPDKASDWFWISFAIASGAQLILYIALIYGVFVEKPKYVRAWIIGFVAPLSAMAIAGLVRMIQALKPNSEDMGIAVGTYVGSILIALYFFVVVKNYYTELIQPPVSYRMWT